MSGHANHGPVAPLPARKLALAAFAGGIAGSLVRALAEQGFALAGLPPWSSRIAVNVSGAFLIGGLFGRLAVHDERGAPVAVPHARRMREHLLGAGLLGGLTTVSGFSWDAASAIAAGEHANAALVVACDAVIGIAACAAGHALAATRRGVRLGDAGHPTPPPGR